MPRRPGRPIAPASCGVAIALALSACGPSRYRLADPPAREGLGSEDRRCVLPPPGTERKPGNLDAFHCAAWTDRNQSAVHPHQWIFFPHFGIGASSRMARECPGCVLDVQKGDRPTWSALSLRAPPDGTVIARYDGQLVGGLFHGRGRLETTRTTACVGECTDLFVANGRVADQIALDGAWREGFLVVDSSLTGRYVYDDGERFEGRLGFDPARGPVPGGRGVWVGADGDTYDGDFVDGVREGIGTLTTADGATYAGDWSRGRRHGQGQATWPDGSSYTGAWERDRRHGQGALRMADGSRHEGTFVGDVIEGPGVQHTAAGVRIEAVWAGGKLADGPATLSWVEGSTFVGSLADGAPDGVGVATFPDGSSYRGEWRSGLPHGRGIYTGGDGLVVIGDFATARPLGCVLVRTADGEWVGEVSASLDLTTDCKQAPTPWTAADLIPLPDDSVGPRTLIDAWAAQRRTRTKRAAAESLRPAVAAALLDPAPEELPPDFARIDLSLKWPINQHQRFVHPACILEGDVRVAVDDRPTRIQRGGLIDAQISLVAPARRTSKVCVDIRGTCGAWEGCATLDIGEATSAPTGITIGLEEKP
jgi:hypothetical protein